MNAVADGVRMTAGGPVDDELGKDETRDKESSYQAMAAI